MAVALEVAVDWTCPNCDVRDQTKPLPNRLHNCAGLHGLTAPLVRAGVSCKVEAVEFGDYVGKAQGVRYDERGKPIQWVKTTRDDGQDATVFTSRAVAKWADQ